jgi:hypothetical protein
MKKGFRVKTCDECTIKIAKSFEEVEAIRDIWMQMQQDESGPALNTDIDYYLSVLESLKETAQPYVIVLYNNSAPEAIVIGRLETRQITCRIGYTTIFKPSLHCLAVVYGGILGKPSEQTSAKMLQELTDTLRRGDADVVFLNHLRIDSRLYYLATSMPGFWCKDHSRVIESHWQTHIPESIEAFYKIIPSKHKREWRRCERKLAGKLNGPVEVVCYRNEKDVDYIIETSCEISRLTYKHTLDVGIVDNALTRATLKQAARNGILRAYLLYVNDVPCAFEIGVCCGDVFLPEYMGYDPKWTAFGPGALLWVKVIEDLCTDPLINILDYGFGDAAYKERLGTKSWPEASVYIFAPRLRPVVINMLRISVSVTNSILRFIVQKVGSVGWIKRRWRSLLQAKNLDDKYVIEK